MRDNPSITKTDVVDVLPFGTPVKIVQRDPTKVELMDHHGYWFRVVTQSGKSGWIFGKFLASEKSDILKQQASKLIEHLYYSRPQINTVLNKLRETPSSDVQSVLQHVKPEAYNYLAYHLILEQHPRGASRRSMPQFVGPF